MDETLAEWNESLHYCSLPSLSWESFPIFSEQFSSASAIHPTNTDGLELSRNLGIGSFPFASSYKSANKLSDDRDLTYQLK